jgi:hypothetical protein
MKTFKTLSLFCLIFISGYSCAQSIDGNITLSGLSSKSTLKETTVVDFFKSFKDGTYKIKFSYKADKVNRRGVVLFDMKTTVKLNGKTILQSTRGGWPWLPGDMFVPIEAFDLIPGIQKAGRTLTGGLFDPIAALQTGKTLLSGAVQYPFAVGKGLYGEATGQGKAEDITQQYMQQGIFAVCYTATLGVDFP